MRKLAGRVAVITGAGSGIGAAMARRFANAGMNIVAADVDDTALSAICNELDEAGHMAIGVRTDVSNAALAAEFRAEAPLGRFALPKEIADLVLYLASDESSYVTCAEFTIDGGVTAR